MDNAEREARQAALLDAYTATLLAAPDALPPAGLDPALAATARALARHLGPPPEGQPAAPDPAFRTALRERLAAQAAGRAPIALAPSPNGAMPPADPPRTPLPPAAPPRIVRRGPRPGAIEAGFPPPAAARHTAATAPTPSDTPPAPARPARRSSAAWSGALGRVGAALLIVAVIGAAIGLLRSTIPPGRPVPPSAVLGGQPGSADLALIAALRDLQPRVPFPLVIPADTRGFLTAASASGSPDPTTVTIALAEAAGPGRATFAQATGEPAGFAPLVASGPPTTLRVRGQTVTVETGQAPDGAGVIRLRWQEGGVSYLLQGSDLAVSRLENLAASLAPLAAQPPVPATPERPSAPPAPTAPAPATPVAVPRWQPTGALAAPRAGHTATTLADGRVLVAGGMTPREPGGTGTAELYDPRAGTWAATGRMATGRTGHAAVLLPDGRVLVVGGTYDGADRAIEGAANAELYDPTRGVWSAAAAPPRPAGLARAALLADGRALVVAGSPVGTPPASQTLAAYAYDPRADQWVQFNRLVPGDLPELVALRDGRALLLGLGVDTAGDKTIAYILEPATGRVVLATLPGARVGFSATALPDGGAIVVGGIRGGGLSASALRFDPATNTWAETAALNTPRAGHAATTLADGRVMVVGSTAGSGDGTAEIYAPQTRTWTALGATGGAARLGFALAPLASGQALVIGGATGGPRSESVAEVRIATPPALAGVAVRPGPPATLAGTPGAGVASTPGAAGGVPGDWSGTGAGLLFFGGRGYRLGGSQGPGGNAPALGAAVGRTLLRWQSGGVFPAGTALYAVAGESPEEWLAIRDSGWTVLYRRDDPATALLAGIQVIEGTVLTDGALACPGYGCPSAAPQAQPGTVATANRVRVEAALQGGLAPGLAIEVRQMGVPTAALPNDRVAALQPGQRVVLILQPAQRQSIDNFSSGDYYWTGPGWVYGFVGEALVPLGGAGGVQTTREGFAAAIRDIFAAVTPRAPTDPPPTPRSLPTATGPVPTAPPLPTATPGR